MVKKTRKVGTTGRFGPRYGVSVRRRIAQVEKRQRRYHLCPRCTFLKVKRVSTGIYRCRHCKLEFAGGAYYPGGGER